MQSCLGFDLTRLPFLPGPRRLDPDWRCVCRVCELHAAAPFNRDDNPNVTDTQCLDAVVPKVFANKEVKRFTLSCRGYRLTAEMFLLPDGLRKATGEKL